MNDLIRKRATGSSEEFAHRMGLCRSELMNCLCELRQLGGQIGYCRRQRTYYYRDGQQLFIGFVSDTLIRRAKQTDEK